MSDELPARIRFMAMNYLSRREHSIQELFDKIQRRLDDVDADTIKTQLQRLKDQGLQSDQRFAESFARGRAERGYGVLRIRQELSQKGLAEDLIAQALGDISESASASALAQLQKRYEPGHLQDYAVRAKAQQFLYRRGFDLDSIRLAIKEFQEQPE